MEYVIPIILVLIAYQLWKVNNIRQEELRLKLLFRKEDIKEEMLKHKFPNIFLDYRSEIKEWYDWYKSDLFDRGSKYLNLIKKLYTKNEFEEKKRRLSNEGTQEEIDQLFDWYAIWWHLQKEAKGEKEILEELNNLGEYSLKFMKSARSQTKLTDVEIMFLLHQMWSNEIAPDANKEIELPREKALMPDIYERTLDSYLTKYAK